MILEGEGEKIYRFRPYNRALSEISGNYFWFSDFEHLNDTTEGFSKIFWEGSQKDWHKLLLDYFCYLCGIIVDKKSLQELDNEVAHCNFGNYFCQNIETLEKAEKIFFQNKDIINIKDILASKKQICSDLLLVFLIFFGKYIITIIQEISQDVIKFKDVINITNKDLSEELHRLLESPISTWDFHNPWSNNAIDPFTIHKKYLGVSILDRNKYLQIIINLLSKNAFDNNIINFKKYSSLLGEIIKQIPYPIPKINFEIHSISTNYINMFEKRLNKDFKISSFSKIYNAPSLWGHYAQGDKGVCLIFDKKKLLLDFKKQNPLFEFYYSDVKYENESKEVNWFEISNNNISNYGHLISQKLSSWEPEQETRIIVKNMRENKLEYDYSALTGVIFGDKMQQKDKVEFIKELGKIKKTFINTKFYEIDAYKKNIYEIPIQKILEGFLKNIY